MDTAERRRTLFSLAETALAFAGAAVAGTLWWAHRANVELPCTAGGGCDVVAASKWAHVSVGPLHDVPLALCGFVSYLVLLTLAMAKWGTDSPRTARVLSTLLVIGTLAGTVFSWYLQWLAHYKLGAFCVWCRASALIMTALFAAAVWEALMSKTPTPAFAKPHATPPEAGGEANGPLNEFMQPAQLTANPPSAAGGVARSEERAQ